MAEEPAGTRLRAAAAESPELAAAMESFVAAARADHPDLIDEVEETARWTELAKLLSAEPTEWAATIAALHAGDLILAWAALGGAPGAIARFDALFTEEVGRALRRARPSDDSLQETGQRLRERLLLGVDGSPPALASYAGRGSLKGWLRVTVLRDYLKRRGRAARLTELGSGDRSPDLEGIDPELAYMKALYRAEFDEAFRTALTELEPKDRNLLRYVHVERLPIEKVATIHAMHRVSVSRWLGRLRRQIAERTRATLAERLGVEPGGEQSVLRLIQSQIDLSLGDLL